MAKEHITFNSRTIAGRIPPGNKASIGLENNIGMCFCWTTKDEISVTAMTDNDYPENAAFILINNIIMQFRDAFGKNGTLDSINRDTDLKWGELEVFHKNWQNPHEADKLMKIEKELFEVKEIVHKNLVDLLKRGEEMDQLMAKSNDLSSVSVDFYKKAKKANSKCCNMG
mmetsp:Transcript_102823/g.142205  ORF Transcript_102823/g.142205 Transcript_102823/m.142205 type:complete len:170 (+) Transcript_102823:127-636(+)